MGLLDGRAQMFLLGFFGKRKSPLRTRLEAALKGDDSDEVTMRFSTDFEGPESPTNKVPIYSTIYQGEQIS